MIMNKMLALCMSPDQGGLELYFLKFAKYYNNDNLFVACTRNSYIAKNIVHNKLECNSRGFINNILNFHKLRKYYHLFLLQFFSLFLLMHLLKKIYQLDL